MGFALDVDDDERVEQGMLRREDAKGMRESDCY